MGRYFMGAKNQGIKYLVRAIDKVKSEKIQDDKNNPVLTETLDSMEKTLLDKLYEETSAQLNKQKNTPRARSRLPKKQTPLIEQKDVHNGTKN
jgi:hypothetical protein